MATTGVGGDHLARWPGRAKVGAAIARPGAVRERLGFDGDRVEGTEGVADEHHRLAQGDECGVGGGTTHPSRGYLEPLSQEGVPQGCFGSSLCHGDFCAA